MRWKPVRRGAGKEGIYGLMLLWGLEPDEVLADVPITWGHTKPDARAANV